MSPETLNYEVISLNGNSEIRFVQIRQLFGGGGYINTDTTKGFTDPVTINFSITFNGSILNENFEIDESGMLFQYPQ